MTMQAPRYQKRGKCGYCGLWIGLTHPMRPENQHIRKHYRLKRDGTWDIEECVGTHTVPVVKSDERGTL
jgi:hypothetical protein